MALFLSASLNGWLVAKGCWGVAAAASAGLAVRSAAGAAGDAAAAPGGFARASGRVSSSFVSLVRPIVTSDPVLPAPAAPGAAARPFGAPLPETPGRRMVREGVPPWPPKLVPG